MLPILCPLSSLLTVTVTGEPSYISAHASLAAQNRDLAAFRVAAHIAWNRCDGAPQYVNAWLDRYQGGPPHDADLLACMSAFLASESIGTPADPAPGVHLEGFVAEHIWHLLTLEQTISVASLVRVDGPDWSVTDSGGDGLAIYQSGNAFWFRLWESKAHTGAGTVKDVVNGACRQLDSRALRYLARFSKVGQGLVDTSLQSFYGMLPELWRKQAPEAGGGVSVATASAAIAGCFANLGSYWGFANADQRQGLVVVVDDFAGFAKRVRDHLWKGL